MGRVGQGFVINSNALPSAAALPGLCRGGQEGAEHLAAAGPQGRKAVDLEVPGPTRPARAPRCRSSV